jgi:NADH-quinone oxidoreductase subunit A
VIFLVPWAAVFKALAAQGADMRRFVYLEMMIFVGLLLVGYIYVVKKGAFDWGERARREAEAEARALADLEARRIEKKRTAA